IHVEHGNQYDRFCSFRSPMAPFTPDGREVDTNPGSLVVRHLIGRLGYFNPVADHTFDLDAWGYVRHWARYYLLTRRSLVGRWIAGAAAVAYLTFRGARARRMGD